MLVYWLMFLAAALAALVESRNSNFSRSYLKPAWIAVGCCLSLLIGFRYEVGGDWGNYIRNLSVVAGRTLADVLALGDPGYQLVSWLAVDQDWGIFGINVICGLVFSIGLVIFCLNQPRPWLALLASVPYLIIVVAMGYSRQAVAIGLAMIGLVALSRGRNLSFFLWIALAITFHKSAAVLVPIAILAATEKRIWTALWVGVAAILLYYFYLQGSYEDFYLNYVQAQYQSQGAAIRVAMNAVPAAIFLLWRRRFALARGERKLWTWLSFVALIFVPVLIVSPSSTAVDRLALYFIPLQIFVFARLPDAIMHTPNAARAVSIGIIGYFGSVQFVWLFFAAHAEYWLPYRLYLFEMM